MARCTTDAVDSGGSGSCCGCCCCCCCCWCCFCCCCCCCCCWCCCCCCCCWCWCWCCCCCCCCWCWCCCCCCCNQHGKCHSLPNTCWSLVFLGVGFWGPLPPDKVFGSLGMDREWRCAFLIEKMGGTCFSLQALALKLKPPRSQLKGDIPNKYPRDIRSIYIIYIYIYYIYTVYRVDC